MRAARSAWPRFSIMNMLKDQRIGQTSNWLSIPKQPMRSASRFRRICSARRNDVRRNECSEAIGRVMSGKYAWLRGVGIVFCGIAAAWPLFALAQPNVRVRHIAVIMNSSADEPDAPVRVATLRRALQDLGWYEGTNLRIDFRWGSGE